MNSNETSEIEVVVTNAGATRRFDKVDEFLQWLGLERDKWKWLVEARQQVGSTKPILNAQFYQLAGEYDRLATAFSGEPAQVHSVGMSAAAAVSDLVRKGKVLTSEDPGGAFVLLLEKSDRIVAAYAVALFLGIPTTDSEVPFQRFEGRFRALAFRLGIAGNVEPTRNTLGDLIVEHRTALETERTRSAAAHLELKNLIELETSDAQLRRDEFAAAERVRVAEATHQQDGREKEFGNLKKTFLEFMKLKAPVDYWTQSAFWHRIVSAIFGVAAIIWGAVIAWQATKYAKALVQSANTFQPSIVPWAKAPIVVDNPPVWELALLLFLVTLAVWLLRVLVRVMLSNLHQGADAASRATMTQAYLALMQEGKALSDQDRILVLTTLFRPMATGLIKDDGMPPSLTELLSRLVGGKGTWAIPIRNLIVPSAEAYATRRLASAKVEPTCSRQP